MNVSFSLANQFNPFIFLSDLVPRFQRTEAKKVKDVELEYVDDLRLTYSIETIEAILTALNHMVSDAISNYEHCTVQEAQNELNEIFNSGLTLEFINSSITELNQSNQDVHYKVLNVLGQTIKLLFQIRDAIYILSEIVHREEIDKFLADQIQTQKNKGGKLTFASSTESLKYLFGEDLKNEPKH